MQHFFSWLGGIVVMLGLCTYALSLWQGKTTAEKSSWIIWLFLDAIALTGMYTAHALNGQMVGTVIGEIIVVVCGFTRLKPGWNTIDKMCLASACLAVICWALTKNPVVGIAISILTLFIGAIPTFIATWHDPTHEHKLSWVLFWISCIFTILSLSWPYTIAEAIQPYMFFLIETIMMALLFLLPFLRLRLSPKPVANNTPN